MKLTRQGVRNLDAIGPKPRLNRPAEARYCFHDWSEWEESDPRGAFIYGQSFGLVRECRKCHRREAHR